MEPEDSTEDEGPFSSWLSPDDRLWRHPSEFHPSEFRSHASEVLGSFGEEPRGTAALVRSSPARTWAVAVVAGLIGALLASGVSLATGELGRKTTVLETVTKMASPTTMALASRSGGAPNWPSVASAIQASVVAVMASDGSSGSGVLYSTSSSHSYIITSDELVTGSIQVTLNNGYSRVGRLVRSDAKSGLALIAIAGGERPVPTFGSVAGLRVAQPLLAVGVGATDGGAAPLSVQSVDEAVSASDDQTMIGMLAVTGSSPTERGGVLVDANDDVVGITTSMNALDPAQQNTFYAIPIDVAEHVARQLLNRQAVTHPYVGLVDTVDLSQLSAKQLGVSGGALVEAVALGSPAARAGLTANDVVTSFNGSSVASAGSLVAMLSASQPGKSVRISYCHQGKPATVMVGVVEQPTSIVDPGN